MALRGGPATCTSSNMLTFDRCKMSFYPPEWWRKRQFLSNTIYFPGIHIKVCGRSALRPVERQMTCWCCLLWAKRGKCLPCRTPDTALSLLNVVLRACLPPECWCWVVRKWRKRNFQALWTTSRRFTVETWRTSNSFRFVSTHAHSWTCIGLTLTLIWCEPSLLELTELPYIFHSKLIIAMKFSTVAFSSFNKRHFAAAESYMIERGSFEYEEHILNSVEMSIALHLNSSSGPAFLKGG